MLHTSSPVIRQLSNTIKHHRNYTRELGQLRLTPLQAAVLIGIMDSSGAVTSDWFSRQDWASNQNLARAFSVLVQRMVYRSYSAGDVTYRLTPPGIAAATAAKEIFENGERLADDDW